MKKVRWKEGIPILFKLCFVCIGLTMVLCQCDDKFDKYYDTSSNDLGAPIIDQLQADQDFSVFLDALKKTELDKFLTKGSVYTIFAPTNAAFQKYEQKTGLQVSSMDVDQLRDLLSYHIVYGLHYQYSFDKDYKNDGLVSYDTRWMDEANHQAKQVSIYPSRFFGRQSSLKDYSQDYQEVYGTSFAETFNVDGIPVLSSKMDIDCENGTIQGIDEVLEPPLRMDNFLLENDQVNLFGEILERFDTLVVDPENTYTNEEGVLVEAFKKQYTRQKYGIPLNPADESELVTAIVPSNTALNQFFEPYNQYYDNSLDNYPDDIMLLVVKNALAMGKKFKLDMPLSLRTISNTIYGIKDWLTSPAKPVSNGLVYVTDKMLAPKELASVTGDIMLNPEYSDMKFALTYTGVLNTLSKATRPGTDIVDGVRERIPVGYTVFAVPNSAWDEAGIDVYNLPDENGKKYLRSIVEFLVVKDSVYAFDTSYEEYGKGIEPYQFRDGYYESMNGTYFEKREGLLYGGDRENPIAITTNEKHYENGTVHFIDKLLLGPDASMNLLNVLGANPDCGLIYAELENNPETYSSLVTEFTDNSNTFTFFCPSDAALAAYNTWAESTEGYTKFSDMTDEEKVVFLKNHLIRKRIFQGAFSEDQRIWTTSGKELIIKMVGGELMVDDQNPITEDAMAIGQKNDQGVNGVVQPMDKVLLPQ
ncbi:fasciclin domain-containing protein [Puteibacter caeruleilacunae]|nr:fasciclin domain-containing protein [Puteibacter caeruleilacunae]